MDTKAYDAVARHFLYYKNRTHPALKLAMDALDELLARAALYDTNMPKPQRMDADGKLRHELARLHKAGVTGRAILIICAGLHSFARDNVGVVGAHWIGSRRHRFCLARHVLQHTSRQQENQRRPATLSPRVLDLCGERLIEITDRVLTALAPALARHKAHSQSRYRQPTATQRARLALRWAERNETPITPP
jgi:hypothetical protein